MSTSEYRRKRNFRRTPEPSGRARRNSASTRFVIHKHAARNLHYDLRLELDGVLKSWAIPKGPCLNPAEKRLAILTEDHPLDYLEFEDVIPEGEYGAGAMIIWDQGDWFAETETPADALQKGELKFRLNGQKLQGQWMLVRWVAQSNESGQDSWLLMKERDEFASVSGTVDLLAEFPHSVLSGRSVEELAALRGRSLPPTQRRQMTLPGPAANTSIAVREIPKAKKAALPKALKPQLASPNDEPPNGPKWLHEIKFDGYRLLCFINGNNVRFLTRNNNDWTDRFEHLTEFVRNLNLDSAVLDGEVVALLPNGVSSFALLQSSLKEGREQRLTYFAFDLLYLSGFDIRDTPLELRKAALEEILSGSDSSALQYVDHIESDGDRFFLECQRLGLEGVVSKRRDRAYRSGRTNDWIKAKCLNRDEFVIVGFTEPEGTRHGFGALLLGYFNDHRQLVYAGKVGTGFDMQQLTEIRERFESARRKRSPIRREDRAKLDRDVHWVRPELVAQIQYANWTADGLLRHPVFQGLREDMPASSVVRAHAAADEPSEPRSGRPSSRRTNLSDQQLDQLSNVRMTHPERVVYPDVKLTKFDLAKYYAEIHAWILPELAGRPLSLVRCTQGQGGPSFFQKHPAKGTPAAIRRVIVPGNEEPFLEINDLAGLVSLVQIGALEIHPWNARFDQIDRPDRMIFDLDPDVNVAWHRVIEAAFLIRDSLDGAGLESFVKTSGGKGLHIVVPIQRRHEWAETKAFTRAVGRTLAQSHPQLFTTSPRKQAREGRIFLDCNRNSRGATTAAAYSTRNHTVATVSMPVSWEEMSEHIGPDHFTVLNAANRLAHLATDPWERLRRVRQSITTRARKQFGL